MEGMDSVSNSPVNLSRNKPEDDLHPKTLADI